MAASDHPTIELAGRYRVQASLGQGGAGAVFRVLDGSSGRQFALKQLLASEAASSEASMLFRKEYYTLAQLKHPSIVDVYEYGVSSKGPYYTMELLEGSDLRDLAPLPFGAACRLLRDVASALAFLHARKLIHRDVSPRNVRCTKDRSKAKLIDFGALATVGLSTTVIGTPPFIPPEALRGLPLDHRVDLYGLGALAYWLLTGRHAYPARRLDELEELWQVRPASPAALVPELPAALDQLVMSLLSLNALGRPATAAEVIDRLSAIGGLEPMAEGETVRGYLASARTVGRQQQIEQLCARVKRAIGGAGRSVLIEAASGMGKSRLMRELALEAQVLGTTVLRARGESVGGAYGVVRALAVELLEKAPKEALAAAKPHAAVLASVVPELKDRLEVGTEDLSSEDPLERRRRVQVALVGWLQAATSERTLLLLIDDLQRCDESSAAVLATLAHEASGFRMLLALGLRTDEDVRAPVPLAALRDASARMRLRGLEARDVADLVKELFGDVPNAVRLAKWMHRAAGGSPLQCTELARHLVDRGLVRYVDGIWIIPDQADHADLPRSLATAMDARIGALSPAARALGEVLSVNGGAFSLQTCVMLAGAKDEQSVFSALDELAREEVVVGAGHSYQFRHDGLREALLRGLDVSKRQALHLRIGEALLVSGAVTVEREVEIGWHLHRGGQERRGAELLDRAGRVLFAGRLVVDAIPALEMALTTYEHEGHAPSVCVELRALLLRAAFFNEPTLAVRYQDRTIEMLREYSGVRAASRLGRYLGRTFSLLLGMLWAALLRRFTPAERRGPKVLQAFVMLPSAVLFALAVANRRNDYLAVEKLIALLHPALVLEKHSPLRVIYDVMTPMADNRRGRLLAARAKHLRNLDVLAKKPRFMSPTDIADTTAATYSQLAIVQAMSGSDEYRDWLDKMEALGLKSWHRWTPLIRALYHAMRGEEAQAKELQTQAEIRAVQLGGWWIGEVWFPVECAAAYGLIRDVIGLKRTIEQLDRMVKAGFCLQQNLDIARGDYLRERGELEESRAAFERALAMPPAGESLYRQNGVAGLAETLAAMQKYDEAIEIAREGEAHCREPTRGHLLAALRLGRTHALAQAAKGDSAGGKKRLDDLLTEAHALGNPAICGLLHEARARVAWTCGDEEDYAIHRAETERWFRPTQNPVLIAVHERLAELALTGEGSPDDVAGQAGAALVGTSSRSIMEGVSSVLSLCRGKEERAMRALELLIEETAAASGYLFALQASGLELVAPTYGAEPPKVLVEGLRAVMDRVVAADETPESVEDVTVTSTASATTGRAEWELRDGDTQVTWRAILLRSRDRGRAMVSGAALVARGPLPLRVPDTAFLDAIAGGLRERGDVVSVEA